MSFKINVSAKDRVVGRFKGRAHRAIVKAAREAKSKKGLTQSEIAEIMGVDKSFVSRILNGKGNLTLQTIGEISWVLGLRPDLVFSEIVPEDQVGSNSANPGSHCAHATSSNVTLFKSFGQSTQDGVTASTGG